MLFRAAHRITTRVTSRMQQLFVSPQVLRSASTSGASTERARRVKVSHILLPADSEALLVDLESRLAGEDSGMSPDEACRKQFVTRIRLCNTMFPHDSSQSSFNTTQQ